MTSHKKSDMFLPKRIVRIEGCTARYFGILRLLDVEAAAPTIYHYRSGNIPIGCAALLLSLFCIRSKNPGLAAAALMLIPAAMYLLVGAWRGGAWFVFADEKLYVRDSTVAGIFHEQFAVDKKEIESVLFDARRIHLYWYGNHCHYDVAVVTREGKKVYLLERERNFDRAQWLSRRITAWIEEKPDAKSTEQCRRE